MSKPNPMEDALGPVEGALFRAMFPPAVPVQSVSSAVTPQRVAELDAEWERVLADAAAAREARRHARAARGPGSSE
jgi:hypothetical protein